MNKIRRFVFCNNKVCFHLENKKLHNIYSFFCFENRLWAKQESANIFQQRVKKSDQKYSPLKFIILWISMSPLAWLMVCMNDWIHVYVLRNLFISNIEYTQIMFISPLWYHHLLIAGFRNALTLPSFCKDNYNFRNECHGLCE